MLTHRLHHVKTRIATACASAGRDPSEITLLAVSKFHPASAVVTLAEAGQIDFGENYVQEMLTKIHETSEQMPLYPFKWHFIGPLQSNKCKEIALYADTLHSLDRIKLVEPLARYRPSNLPPLTVCLQVNIDDEQSKAGVTDWQDLLTLAQEVQKHESLRLGGLMSIPTPNPDPIAQRAPFMRLRVLRDRLAEHLNITLPLLSMGMSADLEAAIHEGATIVRIGTDIFGQRPVKEQQKST